jgi:glyoxylase-like metal-dependent hydrolase (beta-lactamase superfamily II)
MIRFLTSALVALTLTLPNGASSQGVAPPAIKLWRLDCGQFSAPRDNFSDLMSHPGERADYVDSCYLIRHGKDLLLWDAGLPLALLDKPEDRVAPVRMTLRTTIALQLARLGYSPADVTVLGISHLHSDHTGQAEVFSKARLLMDKGDFEALRANPAPFFSAPATLRPWLSGSGATKLISGDFDVFGDGSVTMIALPGHTAGNHGLLVRLPRAGTVLLSGDALHAPDQLETRAMPPSNPSRADSLASIDRILGITRETHAKLIVQHDTGSVARLPAFPEGAE